MCASEFNAVSDIRIKTNIEDLELGIDILLKLRPISYNYKNKYRMGINPKIGLIAQDVEKILPSIVYSSFSQIDNINTEFNKNDIHIDNNKVTLKLNDLDIQECDKLEICDINDEGLTCNIRTVDILEVSDNEFSFIDSKIDTSKNLFISGKHVNDFKTIDYIALITILINSVKQLNEKINLLESKITILESNKQNLN